MPNRACFVVDGFNVYHSLRTAERQSGHKTRWLNLRALCESYLYVLRGGATNEGIYYFSALAHHREAAAPGGVQRHQDYIAALRASGVQVQLAQFKEKPIHCPSCGHGWSRYEEKETDVAVAAQLIELLATDACDTAVVVSGDTDLLPAIRTGRRLFPAKRIVVAFPHGRFNAAFLPVATSCFKIKMAQYPKFQFADPFIAPDGTAIPKPASW